MYRDHTRHFYSMLPEDTHHFSRLCRECIRQNFNIDELVPDIFPNRYRPDTNTDTDKYTSVLNLIDRRVKFEHKLIDIPSFSGLLTTSYLKLLIPGQDKPNL